MLHFGYPIALFLLIGLPLVALALVQRDQRIQRDLADYARPGMLMKMGISLKGPRRLVRGALLLGAVACGLLALSEPRWGGQNGNTTVTTHDGSLVIVLDVSRSMLAQDMGGESRLAVAEQLVAKLLPSFAGWRVGLVGFAGQAQALVPLTTDQEALQTLLVHAQPGSVPGKGSNLEAGLAAALPLFDRPGRRIALVLTDGEELAGDATHQASALAAANVEVAAIGMGTPEGGFLPGPADVWGNPTYLTYKGDRVTSRLTEAPLQRLASSTHGFYLRAVEGGTSNLASRLGASDSGANSAVPDAVDGPGVELFQLPLAFALLLLLVEACLGLGWRPRRRFEDDLRLALERPALALCLLSIVLTQSGWTWYPSWLPNREAGDAFKAGQFDRAGELLDGALAHDPDNFGLQYNRASVAYQQKHYHEAAELFKKALAHADKGSKQAIEYNLGDALFREAEGSKAPMPGYKAAIVAYEHVLKARPTDADARHNLEVAKQRLKQASHNPQSGGPSPPSGDQGKPQSGQAPQPQQAGAGTPQAYKPPPLPRNLPSEPEVDALLKALEADERQRQAEAGAQGAASGETQGKSLFDEALGALDMEKDW